MPFAAVASAGALNVFLMRGGELSTGIDVFPVLSESERRKREDAGLPAQPESLGKSKSAARIAVGETALSRVFNATPVMAIPPLILVRLQNGFLKNRPRMVLPVNLGLIFGTSLFALPLALGVFPQKETVRDATLEEEFKGKGGVDGMIEFNRGI